MVRRPAVVAAGATGVVSITSRFAYNLAVQSDGSLWEWGFKCCDFDGPYTNPLPVSKLTEVEAAAAAYAQNLALKRDGTVWEWGQCGSTPVQVCGLSGVASIAAGGAHSLAVKRDGTVWAWGANYQGQLGEERTTMRTTPVQVVPPGSPDLAIGMSHAGDFTVGGQGVYTLAINNIGATATAGTVTVTYTLPPGLTYLSGIGDGWSCSAANEIVTCTNPGPINPRSSSTITLTVNAGASALPGVTNLATVSNQSDRNISNNTIGDPAVVSPGR